MPSRRMASSWPAAQVTPRTVMSCVPRIWLTSQLPDATGAHVDSPGKVGSGRTDPSGVVPGRTEKPPGAASE